ncbi:RnfH family protein [Solimonas sp. K1W22B-7]|uniref:RnfH family protein n=1 Tax=Solimonas sp. K1W22B-7 TaxID=2303331 RepID=UPI000E335C2D|nr:RnfH family protein [Solimonas sp. K1W22B-7]AXQ29261.1 RnfH family protein [Solimonas sp. K1W22B-7]
MVAAENIRVEVAYALAERQLILELEVPAGTRAGEAVERSGMLRRFPEIDLSRNRLGIFSRPVTADEPLQDGDRVEIYRPLLADPKQVRRQRAAASRKKGS